MSSAELLVAIAVVGATGLVLGVTCYFCCFRVWFRESPAGVRVPLAGIFRTSLHGVSPRTAVDAHRARLRVTIGRLEAHQKSGGNVRAIIQRLARGMEEAERAHVRGALRRGFEVLTTARRGPGAAVATKGWIV